MWHPIGFCVVGPASPEVRVGRFAGDLPGGVLHLRVAYHGPASPDPLSFFILDFLGDDGVRSLGSSRWWPRSEPSVVVLGPSYVSTVAGFVLLRARSYNTRWLSAGLPEPVAKISIQAYLPSGSSSPLFVPGGLFSGPDQYGPIGDPVGPAGAYALGKMNA